MKRRSFLAGGLTCLCGLSDQCLAQMWPKNGCLNASISAEFGKSLGDYEREHSELSEMMLSCLSVLDLDTTCELSVHGSGSVAAAYPPCGEITPYRIHVSGPTFRRLIDDVGTHAALFVVAHEIGHIAQYQSDRRFESAVCGGSIQEIKFFELLADCAAGYVITKLTTVTERQSSTVAVIAAITELSDYNFSNVQHHGTLTERYAAAGLGSMAAMEGVPLDMAVLLQRRQRFERSLFAADPLPNVDEMRRRASRQIRELFR